MLQNASASYVTHMCAHAHNLPVHVLAHMRSMRRVCFRGVSGSHAPAHTRSLRMQLSNGAALGLGAWHGVRHWCGQEEQLEIMREKALTNSGHAIVTFVSRAAAEDFKLRGREAVRMRARSQIWIHARI